MDTHQNPRTIQTTTHIPAYVVCTDVEAMDSFLGAHGVGAFITNATPVHAYTFETVEHAAAAARQCALSADAYMVGTLADFAK